MREIKFRAWRDIANSKFENATEVYRHTPKGMSKRVGVSVKTLQRL